MSLIKTLKLHRSRQRGDWEMAEIKCLRKFLSLLLSHTHLCFSVGLNYSASCLTHNHEVNHSIRRRVSPLSVCHRVTELPGALNGWLWTLVLKNLPPVLLSALSWWYLKCCNSLLKECWFCLPNPLVSRLCDFWIYLFFPFAGENMIIIITFI